MTCNVWRHGQGDGLRLRRLAAGGGLGVRAAAAVSAAAAAPPAAAATASGSWPSRRRREPSLALSESLQRPGIYETPVRPNNPPPPANVLVAGAAAPLPAPPPPRRVEPGSSRSDCDGWPRDCPLCQCATAMCQSATQGVVPQHCYASGSQCCVGGPGPEAMRKP